MSGSRFFTPKQQSNNPSFRISALDDILSFWIPDQNKLVIVIVNHFGSELFCTGCGSGLFLDPDQLLDEIFGLTWYNWFLKILRNFTLVKRMFMHQCTYITCILVKFNISLLTIIFQPVFSSKWDRYVYFLSNRLPHITQKNSYSKANRLTSSLSLVETRWFVTE